MYTLGCVVVKLNITIDLLHNTKGTNMSDYRQKFYDLDITEPDIPRDRAGWKRVALDLYTNDRAMIESMRRELELPTTREVIRRALALMNAELSEAREHDQRAA